MICLVRNRSAVRHCPFLRSFFSFTRRLGPLRPPNTPPLPISYTLLPFRLFHQSLFSFNLPLSSPLHTRIRNQKRRQPIQNLMPSPSERVEDRGIQCARQGSLSVRGEGVGCDVLLGL